MKYKLEAVIKNDFLDDKEMFLDIAGGFIEEYPILLAAIDEAIDQDCPKKTLLSIHKLRGAVSSFRIEEINSIMGLLEEASPKGCDFKFLKKYSEVKVYIDGFIEEVHSMTRKKSA